MQEFSSVTASSYDAESLAPMLTEKAGEGWSVVGIVSAGTNVVAYLSRGGSVSSGSSDVAAVAAVAAVAEPVVAEPVIIEQAAVIEEASADITAEPPVVVQSWETVDVADAGFVVADEATAITPTLPDEAVAHIPEVASVVESAGAAEAAAAVVASGEPVGWGASADAVASAATDTGSEVASEVGGMGAVASGVTDTAGGYGSGATDVLGGVGEQTGSVVGGYADTAATSASSGVVDAAAGVVGGATAEVTQAAETVVEAVPESSGVPAGWYADPSGRFELRYWDGNAWTEHVSRAGQQYTDPPVA
jgi:Protein of unknown function (DUF2510)